ncbi:type II restriction endonuclease [Metamycoplasma hyosynoviae]|uniref:type II restriction endonuclease n=5 Tax=Metamycoplasma hyosynoviae TaxID=29559 RepID=UPI00055B705B|nr:type II restriction endonuclease [Metamycoplasma hyosynoviae]MDC8912002.1 type II restriction endonuclease [Metamycoplasma hyosynoviae]MDC8914733.1 type II restriction endonuclease [Metamycoplasma hyosynoviae]MDC8916389.1 type II restriction endonuclease [Metamycoplasma hyosynoviae]MDC8918943.1 type II restriction endonuclease [Metamycoplasma hyosynoviae]MDC8927031.1 type II restriction endonuclease [Metamycoplasma hyosynoviae]
MTRNFKKWLKTMKSSIANWTYYTDFEKVYKNVQKIKVELNILNSLIGSKQIEKDFIELINKYPNVLNVIPILLAKREQEILVNIPKKEYIFDFYNVNCSIEEYVLFMKNSGLFNLIQNHIINNLVDYVLGVEVGMDTNSRKNRTGDIMENLVEMYLIKSGLIKNKTYFKEMSKSEIEKKFNLDLSAISNKGKVEKRFDFVFIGANKTIYACECNFYSSNGSKLNEIARSYKTLMAESKDIEKLKFIWFTDGVGWYSSKNNLEEIFEIMENLYNLNDLEEGCLYKLIDIN